MNKGDHLTLSEEVKSVSEVVKKASKPPVLKKEDIIFFYNLEYELTSLADAVIAVHAAARKNEKLPVMLDISLITNLEPIPKEAKLQDVIQELSDSKDFASLYVLHRDTLKESLPATVSYLDRRLVDLVNEILTYNLNEEVVMTGLFVEDIDDLYNYLDGEGSLDEFVEILTRQSEALFNFISSEITLVEDESVEVISCVEKATIVLAECEDISQKLEKGYITDAVLPKLYRLTHAACDLLNKRGRTNSYIYITSTTGGLIKTICGGGLISNTKLNAIVDIIR